MKNSKCNYVNVCRMSIDCSKCDLKNHNKTVSIIIRQLEMDAKQKDEKIKIKI